MPLTEVPIAIDGFQIVDNSSPVATLNSGNQTHTIFNRDYPSHTTRVQVEEIRAEYEPLSPAGGKITIAYKNPHVRPGVFTLWNQATNRYDIPMENHKYFGKLKDYWDVYNPSERDVRRDGVAARTIPLSQLSFQAHDVIDSGNFSPFGPNEQVYLKFDVETSDFDSSSTFPFQSSMIVALVGDWVDPFSPWQPGPNFGENTYIVTDLDVTTGFKRDIHGFLAQYGGPGVKYNYFTRVEQNLPGIHTYGIWIPRRDISFHIYITPAWWDFQGKVTLSNFRLTNSKIFESFRPAEVMADQGESDDRPGWMRLNFARDRFMLFSDDTSDGERASAFNMFLQSYDQAPAGNVFTVSANRQTYRLEPVSDGLNIHLARREGMTDVDMGTISISKQGETGTYALSMLSKYASGTPNQLTTGYFLTLTTPSGEEEIAIIRINGDGTIMIKDEVSISPAGDPDEERVDDKTKGLRIEYVPPADPGNFPVKLYCAGSGTMLALSGEAGLSIHAVHSTNNPVNGIPVVEKGYPDNDQTFYGVRSQVCPAAWYEKDRKDVVWKSVEKDHFILWPFKDQSVWISVLPPKEYTPQPPGRDLARTYHTYRLDNQPELFPSLEGIQSYYPAGSPTYPTLAADLWREFSDYIIVNGEGGLWDAWQNEYKPREPNSTRAYDPYIGPGFNQTITFQQFLSECVSQNKLAFLYVSPFYFTKGMQAENNTKFIYRYYFQDNSTSPTTIVPAYQDNANLTTYIENGFSNDFVNTYFDIGYSVGNNYYGENLAEYESAIRALLDDLEIGYSSPVQNFLNNIGFYFDEIYPRNLASTYYMIRRIRQIFWEKTGRQPMIMYHASFGTPLLHMLLQTPLPESYADVIYKMEFIADLVNNRGVSSASPFGIATDVSLDDLFKYAYCMRGRSNLMPCFSSQMCSNCRMTLLKAEIIQKFLKGTLPTPKSMACSCLLSR